MDTASASGCIMKTDDCHILSNKCLDSRLQGHFSIKHELLHSHEYPVKSMETGTQIDPEMFNMPVKAEPEYEITVKRQPPASQLDQKPSVKVELIEKFGGSTTSTDHNTTPSDPEESKLYIPFCNVSVKQEVDEVNSEESDVGNEPADISTDNGMIKMENGCTNSGCSSQTRCLHTYKCSKCNLVFTERHIFAAHLQECRLNQTPPTVPSNLSTSTPHQPYECEHASRNLKKLIESVRTNPPLYEANNEDYNDIQLKEVIWANIACSCGFINGALAEAAWIKLKESFEEAITTQQNNSLGHQNLTHNNGFMYYKHMEFLLPHVNGNVEDEQNLEDPEMIVDVEGVEEPAEAEVPAASQLTTPAKKQKLMSSATATSTAVNSSKRTRDGRKKGSSAGNTASPRSSSSAHPLHMFFLSMCETTKSLPPHLQLQVKRRVFQAVIEAEEATAALNNNAAHNKNTSSAPCPSSSREDQCNLAVFALDLDNLVDNSSSSSSQGD